MYLYGVMLFEHHTIGAAAADVSCAHCTVFLALSDVFHRAFVKLNMRIT